MGIEGEQEQRAQPFQGPDIVPAPHQPEIKRVPHPAVVGEVIRKIDNGEIPPKPGGEGGEGDEKESPERPPRIH